MSLPRVLERGEIDESALHAGEPTSETPAVDTSNVSHDEMKKAMRAFKKRLKLARLDQESRLSVSPMSSGKQSDIRAIMPPREFGEQVWLALVADGQLYARGQGFYELVDESSLGPV